MEYNFREIEKKWQARWKEQGLYKVDNESSKPPFYVLDMFPYPSGAGLHVGHPLGYIASDIFSRYKRLRGFNVLHPMGFDAYGLPAEQYAIQTGQHPEITTKKNIEHYIAQLSQIGFSFDWDRMVITCDPNYYKWTQWAFLQMFNTYYDPVLNKARPIQYLVEQWNKTDPTWQTLSEIEKQKRLMNYRIAYLSDTKVNWCPQLGTVLANDEVSEGLSIRGGYPVQQKIMRQWCLRISAYAQRLLDGLNNVEWSESIKETQRNWIGKSEGCEIYFNLKDNTAPITIFTTRPDTIFGVTFLVLAPESKYVDLVTTEKFRSEVNDYVEKVKNRTERERITNRTVSGVFSGAFAIHPITQQEIPIYVSDYVLSGYGTGAIMAVPAHDSRDYAFAQTFNLPIIPLIQNVDVSQQAFETKEGILTNSSFLNNLSVNQAIATMKKYVAENNIGTVKTNYKLRDAIFSRQRYWGEPFPIYYKDNMPYPIPENCLPLQLPSVTQFKPNDKGQPPLSNATKWAWDTSTNQLVENDKIDNVSIFPIELCTMPGFAGSSAYFLRYMDNHNNQQLVNKTVNEYWKQVNLYVGGVEHATGHLIYARFWNKVLYDLGYICEDEPFKKMINQGMIQGRSNFVYRYIDPTSKNNNTFISFSHINKPPYKDHIQPIHVDVNIVKNDVLDIHAFRAWMPEYANAEFVFEDGSSSSDNLLMGNAQQKQYICGWTVEKMSKSMFNVVNPDSIIEKYGADTLRMYEMFLGPVELSKPWDTNGIDGVFRFLKKTCNLFDTMREDKPDETELKIINRLIKKVTDDIDKFSFNTSVSAFMIAVNELAKLNTISRLTLRSLAILLSPFAPHLAEELWSKTKNITDSQSICQTQWPDVDEKFILDDTFNCPIQINGKTKITIVLQKGLDNATIQSIVLSNDKIKHLLLQQNPKKIIIVPNKIVNIVV